MHARSLLPLLLGLLGCASIAAQTPSERPPNVLILLADDLRPDWVGAFGCDYVRTPHIDSLAEAGFRFRHAYCMGSWHGAVCQPSRAMLMSGRWLTRVPPDLHGVTTLPQVLHEAGYRTFATGKWHNGSESLAASFERGVALFRGGMCDHHAVPVADLDDGVFHDERVGKRPSSELFADAVIDFLNGRTKAEDGRPFFAYVAFTAPHDPRDPPPEYLDEKRERPPLPANFRPQHGWRIGGGTLTVRDENLAAWPRDPEVIRDQLAEYRGLVEHLDAQIGRILAALRATGELDRTLIVFTSDHGLALGSHGLLGKQSLYEHSMGTPLVIAGPGVSHGGSDAMVYLLDLLPTICEMTGAKIPGGVDGRSLAPVIHGDAARVRDSLFTLYADNQRAIRDDRYKLIRFTKTGKTLLFDLASDPQEIHDLIGTDGAPARVTALLEAMREWQHRVGDDVALDPEQPEPETVDLTGHLRKCDRWQPEWIRKKYFGAGEH